MEFDQKIPFSCILHQELIKNNTDIIINGYY